LSGQVRLCLDHKDYIRAQILSRKINPKVFIESGKEKKKPKDGDNIVEEPAPDVPTLPELRRIYHELMIRYNSGLQLFVLILFGWKFLLGASKLECISEA
jgi:hypothetical protein